MIERVQHEPRTEIYIVLQELKYESEDAEMRWAEANKWFLSSQKKKPATWGQALHSSFRGKKSLANGVERATSRDWKLVRVQERQQAYFQGWAETKTLDRLGDIIDIFYLSQCKRFPLGGLWIDATMEEEQKRRWLRVDRLCLRCLYNHFFESHPALASLFVGF